MANVTQLKNQARHEEQRENWSKAIEFYTRALEASLKKGDAVGDLSLYNRIGDIYMRIGQKNTAVRYYEDAIDQYAEQELHTSAIALCNKVLRIVPHRAPVFLRLGRLNLATNLLVEARENYQRFARHEFEEGRVDGALDAMEEMVRATGDRSSLAEWVRMASTLATDASTARLDVLEEPLQRHGIERAELVSALAGDGLGAAPDGAGELERASDLPTLPLLDDLSIPEPETVDAVSVMPEEAEPVSSAATDSQVPDRAQAVPFPEHEPEFSVRYEPETKVEPEGRLAIEPERPAPPEAEPDRLATSAPAAENALGLEAGEPAQRQVSGVEFHSPWIEEADLEGVAGGGPEHQGSLASEEVPEDDEDAISASPATSFALTVDDLEIGTAARRIEYRTDVETDEGPVETAEASMVHAGGRLSPEPVEPAQPGTAFEWSSDTRATGSVGFAGEPPVDAGSDLPDASYPGPAFAIEPDEEVEEEPPPLEAIEPSVDAMAAAFADPFEAEAHEPGPEEASPGDSDPMDALYGALSAAEVSVSSRQTPADAGALDGMEPLVRSLDQEAQEPPSPPPESSRAAIEGETLDPAGERAPRDVFGAEAAEGAESEEIAVFEPLDDQVEPVEVGEDLDELVALGVERPSETGEELSADGEEPGVDAVEEPLTSVVDAVEELDTMAELSERITPVETVRPATDPLTRIADQISVGASAPVEAQQVVGEQDPKELFWEWVKSASPNLLARALTELELRGEVEKVVMILDRLVEMDWHDTRSLRRRAEYTLELKDPARGMRALTELAVHLEQGGSPFEARGTYERVLALDPRNAVALAAIERIGDVEPDKDAAASSAANRPAGHGTQLPNGDVMNGSHGSAAFGGMGMGGDELYTEERPRPYSGVAGGKEAGTDFEQLLSEFRAELHERPQQSDTMTRTELGASLKQMGKLDDAIRELQAAIREPQAPPTAYELLGEAFREKGQARVAVRLLVKALSNTVHTDRELLGVLYQLGVAHQELDEPTKALNYYERIFSVDIDYKDVQERIIRCT